MIGTRWHGVQWRIRCQSFQIKAPEAAGKGEASFDAPLDNLVAIEKCAWTRPNTSNAGGGRKTKRQAMKEHRLQGAQPLLEKRLRRHGATGGGGERDAPRVDALGRKRASERAPRRADTSGERTSASAFELKKQLRGARGSASMGRCSLGHHLMGRLTTGDYAGSRPRHLCVRSRCPGLPFRK